MRGISGPRLPEELGDEIGEVVPPVAPHVALFGGGEGVLDVVLYEHLVEGRGAGKEAVGFAAGNVEELQFLIGGGGVGNQVLILGLQSLGAHAAAGAEGSDAVENVQVVETHAERLSAAHGEACDGAVHRLGGDSVELLGEGNDILQQVV